MNMNMSDAAKAAKHEALRVVIRKALARGLTKMQDDAIYAVGKPQHINNWAGDALASWIAPGVIASVERHLSRSKPLARKPHHPLPSPGKGK